MEDRNLAGTVSFDAAVPDAGGVVLDPGRPQDGCGGWLCPAVAYQQTAMAWQASMNGTVRSTARAVRLRACPGAEELLRVFYRDFHRPSRSVSFDDEFDVQVLSVVTRARSYPVPGLSRMRMTVTGAVPVTEYHRQVKAATAVVSVLP